jgi:site-specific recombinase XerD
MFYALLVERHLVILNPTLGVRLERESFEEGKTAMLQPKEVKSLLQSIDTGPLVGIRDYAIIATLIGTAARAGGVAGLKVGNFGVGQPFVTKWARLSREC